MSIEAIVLIGVPGAGKGTVADIIEMSTNYIHLSTGDILRQSIKQQTPLGIEAQTYMQDGRLVPDNIVLKVVMEHLDTGHKHAHYMFDGFPRTLAQAELLNSYFERSKARLNNVFLLEVSEEVSIARLTGRRICRKCGANFHIHNMPPRTEGFCDRCGGELYQRSDDRKETIIRRLQIFQKESTDLVSYYERQEILVKMDSSKAPQKIASSIINLLPKIG